MMDVETKAAIESLVSVYEAVAPEKMRYFEIGPFESDSMRIYFAAFLCYLAMADGNISWDECEVIEYYTDLSLAPEEVAMLINHFGIGDGEYASLIPEPLAVLVERDNEIISNGYSFDVYASEVYVKVHKMLALELIVSDGVVDELEKTHCIRYLNLLDNYMENNFLLRRKM